MKQSDFTIIVDTREQTPWCFPEDQQVVRAGLPAGDYSIRGYEETIALERKSLNDLVSTVIHQRDRFFKELVKLKSYRRKLVVVEGDVSDIFELRYNSKAHPFSILGAIQNYHAIFNIPFVFWGSREYAERMALWWLQHIWKRTKRWAEKEKEAQQEREILEQTNDLSEKIANMGQF
jgi:ERCC4-type nuclease